MSPAVKLLLIVIIASNSSQMSDYMRHLTPELLGMALFILRLRVMRICGGPAHCAGPRP